MDWCNGLDMDKPDESAFVCLATEQHASGCGGRRMHPARCIDHQGQKEFLPDAGNGHIAGLYVLDMHHASILVRRWRQPDDVEACHEN